MCSTYFRSRRVAELAKSTPGWMLRFIGGGILVAIDGDREWLLHHRVPRGEDPATWDPEAAMFVAILESMDVAYAFGGHKTQTPTIVVRADPPYGFKGPVMAPAPTGSAALRMWDAIQVLAQEPGFFEITRPRVNRPRVTHP